MSICQALASDEEEEGEGEGERGGVRGGGHLPRTVSDPRELSSALMKALRVGEQQEEEGKEWLFNISLNCRVVFVTMYIYMG